MEWAGAQFLAASALVFGVLGLLWVYAKRGTHALGRAATRHLQLEETLFLDARHKVVRIRHEQTHHVVLLHPHGVTPLESTSNPVLPHISKESHHA